MRNRKTEETESCADCGSPVTIGYYTARNRSGKALCDPCGVGPNPYEGMELFPVRERVPRSREVLRHEVAMALDPARFRTFDETAIHEAGHTVVGWQLRVPIDEVRLGDHGAGESRMRSGDRHGTVRAAITLGADMAVERWFPGSTADEHAPELRRFMADDDVDLDLAIYVTQDILIRHHEEVESLARALAEHGELTGDQVHELLDRSYDKRLRCDGCGQMWPASKMVAHEEDDGERILCMNCLGIYGNNDPVGEIPRYAIAGAVETRGVSREGTAHKTWVQYDPDQPPPGWDAETTETYNQMHRAGDAGDWARFRQLQSRLADLSTTTSTALSGVGGRPKGRR